MAENIIFRDPSDTEKKEFNDLMHKKANYEKIMRVKINDAEGEFLNLRHIPFCRKCAKADFDDAYDRLRTEVSRSRQPLDAVQEKVQALKMDLNNYATEDRFEFIGESPAMENRLIDGIKRQDIDGYYFGFRCKRRGCVIKIRVAGTECVAYRENIIAKYSISKEAKKKKDAEDKRKADLAKKEVKETVKEGKLVVIKR